MIIKFILSALVPAILIASLFYFLDKNKEPVKAVVRAFILGILSIPFLYVVYFIIPSSGHIADGSFETSFFIAFWDAGFHEELSKLILFAAGIYSKKYFDEWYDGILYGVMIGLGFAFVENIYYFQDYFHISGYDIIISRSIFSMPMHALLGGVMGYFIGKAKFTINTEMIPLLWFLALLIPVLIHGLFNFVIYYNGIDISFISIIIAIYMWYYVIKLKKKTQTELIF